MKSSTEDQKSFLEKHGHYIPLSIFAIFLLWVFDVFEDKKEPEGYKFESNSSKVDNYLYFETANNGSFVRWVRVAGDYEGNKTMSFFTFGPKILKNKVLSSNRFVGGVMHNPDDKNRASFLDTQLFEIGDKFVFGDGQTDGNQSYRINNVLFANNLEYLIVEATNENNEKSHFYISPTDRED
jgi:hypothetical protein